MFFSTNTYLVCYTHNVLTVLLSGVFQVPVVVVYNLFRVSNRTLYSFHDVACFLLLPMLRGYFISIYLSRLSIDITNIIWKSLIKNENTLKILPFIWIEIFWTGADVFPFSDWVSGSFNSILLTSPPKLWNYIYYLFIFFSIRVGSFAYRPVHTLPRSFEQEWRVITCFLFRIGSF